MIQNAYKKTNIYVYIIMIQNGAKLLLASTVPHLKQESPNFDISKYFHQN